jgi:CRISPR/Cas system CMR-associated protein Cmr1 (group 7 of RAMP superfamily)
LEEITNSSSDSFVCSEKKYSSSLSLPLIPHILLCRKENENPFQAFFIPNFIFCKLKGSSDHRVADPIFLKILQGRNFPRILTFAKELEKAGH